MKTRFIKKVVVVGFILLSQHAIASTEIFSSLELTNGQICITLPSDGIHWMITITLDKVYRSEYGQRLSLTNGQAVTLSDHHVSHAIRAVVEQNRAGLDVTTTEDMRSFGDRVTQKTFFIEVPRRNKEGQSAGDISPLPGDVRELREPPIDARHGPAINGRTLGLWSEKPTYELNSRMNVWTMLSNTNKDAPGWVPYRTLDPAVDKDNYLIITDEDGKETKVNGGIAADGSLELGFKGGISAQLHENIRRPGTYRLQSKIGAMESNVIEIKVLPPK